MNLSKNFTVAEFEYSVTAEKYNLNNTMPPWAIIAAERLVKNVIQPVRDWAKSPIKISSGWRGKALNKKVRGVANSQHCLGEAADLVSETIPAIQIFRYIINNLEYDQCIYEMELDTNGNTVAIWVHVSYRDGKNRRESLKAVRVGKGKPKQTAFKG